MDTHVYRLISTQVRAYLMGKIEAMNILMRPLMRVW